MRRINSFIGISIHVVHSFNDLNGERVDLRKSTSPVRESASQNARWTVVCPCIHSFTIQGSTIVLLHLQLCDSGEKLLTLRCASAK